MADSSDERIRAMLRGRRDVRVLPMPGFDPDSADADAPTIGVRILLEDEIDAARLEALQFLGVVAKRYRLEAREMLSLDAEILDREIERQLVYRAFVDPTSAGPDNASEYKAFFPAPQAVRQLDSVMQRTLFHCYLDHQNYVSPLRGFDDVEAEELAEALSKGQHAKATLALYDASSLRNLVHILAVRLASVLSGRSSTGGVDGPV